MDTEADLRQRNEALEGDNAELRAEIDQLRAERRIVGRVGVVTLALLGQGLARRLPGQREPVPAPSAPPPQEPSPPTLPAKPRLKLGIEVAGIIVATIAVSAVFWQNLIIQGQTKEIRRQVDQQAGDARIARRAQLLDIIYGEECERPTEVLPRVAVATSQESTGEPTDEEQGPSEPRCWPKAPIRARTEAAAAFLEIEHGNGVDRPDLSKANLWGADLSEAFLSGADLSGADLREADLREADLTGAYLSAGSVKKTYLGNVETPHVIRERTADLTGADLSEVKLTRANLFGVVLSEAKLIRADLREANLRVANLSGAWLLWADLSEAVLSGADLTRAKNLTAKQLEVTIGDEDTRLPEGMERPEHWKLTWQKQQELIRAKLEVRERAKREEP